MINKRNDYKGFIRTTSNTLSTTNHYQVNLPPHIVKKMKWKINEKIRIRTVRGKDVQNYVMIEREIDD
tara:strand:+ start:336 stop:539 length:204 start_codon:yes stop_codon:yes gene_type:complete